MVINCDSLQEKELENLKCKSASDLWKEDLAVFVEELDVCQCSVHVTDSLMVLSTSNFCHN